MRQPKITRIRVHQYEYAVENLGVDYNGFNQVYEPGATFTYTGHIVAIETDAGVTGEYNGGDTAAMAQLPIFTHYLLGRNPLERELIHNDIKRACRKNDRM
ncbi:MAG: mandelate racemase, partial [Thermomicrobiales bacterium]